MGMRWLLCNGITFKAIALSQHNLHNALSEQNIPKPNDLLMTAYEGRVHVAGTLSIASLTSAHKYDCEFKTINHFNCCVLLFNFSCKVQCDVNMVVSVSFDDVQNCDFCHVGFLIVVMFLCLTCEYADDVMKCVKHIDNIKCKECMCCIILFFSILEMIKFNENSVYHHD